MMELVINAVNALSGIGRLQPDPFAPAVVHDPSVEADEEETREMAEEVDDVPPLTHDDNEDDESENEEEKVIEETLQPTRRSARIAQGVKPPERYALATQIQATSHKLDEKQLEAKK